jgi:hypothetical protein
VAPKRLEKILTDILYGVGEVPELVELLLKHGATPTQSAFSAVTTYGHAKARFRFRFRSSPPPLTRARKTRTYARGCGVLMGFGCVQQQSFKVMLNKLTPAEIKRRPLLASSTLINSNTK